MSYSQIISVNNKLPKYALINKDTVVIISKTQMLNINLTYNELDKYKELNSNLNSQINICDKKVIKYQELESNLNDNIKDQESIICAKDSLINDYKETNDKLKSHKKILLISNSIVLLITILLLL